MSEMRRIWVDLMKTDAERRIVLNTVGTQRDLNRLGIKLEEGLVLDLYTDDLDEHGRPDNLIFSGIAHFDERMNRWVASIDWAALRHESELGEQ